MLMPSWRKKAVVIDGQSEIANHPVETEWHHSEQHRAGLETTNARNFLKDDVQVIVTDTQLHVYIFSNSTRFLAFLQNLCFYESVINDDKRYTIKKVNAIPFHTHLSPQLPASRTQQCTQRLSCRHTRILLSLVCRLNEKGTHLWIDFFSLPLQHRWRHRVHCTQIILPDYRQIIASKRSYWVHAHMLISKIYRSCYAPT
jgi:hypothetical protein